LKENPNHSSLHLKKIKNYYSVRAGLKFRALGITAEDIFYGFGLAAMLIMINF
jgi:hypothetical protein